MSLNFVEISLAFLGWREIPEVAPAKLIVSEHEYDSLHISLDKRDIQALFFLISA